MRVYENLFTKEDPEDVEEGRDWHENINPESLKVLKNCKLEPGLAEAKPGDRIQFERLGYFCPDSDSQPGAPVFNRAVTLKDTWAKIAKKK